MLQILLSSPVGLFGIDWAEMYDLQSVALGETAYMVLISGALACLIGTPLGILLTVTSRRHLLPCPALNMGLGWIINAMRSVPFIILMVAIIPLTRLVAGTSIGTTAALVPLTLAAAPFVARVVENALREVDPGVIEAAQSMGATPRQIIWHVLLPEALPGVLAGLTLMVVSLIGYSAMAGTIGGGGLGDLAIRYGYQRFRPDVMVITVIILIVMVQGCQSLGDGIVSRIYRRRGK
jgi:ABC-type metal ion transport system, permease component